MKPHQYDPNSYASLLKLDTDVSCSSNDCKVTQFKVREGWALWYTDAEGKRACAIFCSEECLFHCVPTQHTKQ